MSLLMMMLILFIAIAVTAVCYYCCATSLSRRRENEERLRRARLLYNERIKAERTKQQARIAGESARNNIDRIAKQG